MASHTPSLVAHYYIRGDLQRPGPVVQAALPRIATPQPEQYTYCDSNATTRIRDLAFLSKKPLPARVIVNRIWQRHFRMGLPTPRHSEWYRPNLSHPELLDWLADDLRRKGWSLKSLHREIVTRPPTVSKATRRPTIRNGENESSHPENRWLSRYPRHRLSAETIRDSMLLASGKMNYECGGEVSAHLFR